MASLRAPCVAIAEGPSLRVALSRGVWHGARSDAIHQHSLLASTPKLHASGATPWAVELQPFRLGVRLILIATWNNSYYDGNSGNGSAGDLEKATISKFDGSAWVPFSNTYYRLLQGGGCGRGGAWAALHAESAGLPADGGPAQGLRI